MDVILGNGSDELIQMLILALNGEGRVLLVPEPSFVMYRHEMFEEQTKRIKAERAHLLEQLNALKGVHVWPSQTNFILFRVVEAQIPLIN